MTNAPSTSPDTLHEDTCEDAEQTKAIRDLNDQLRQTFAGGQVFLTPGIQTLPDGVKTKLFHTVRTFDTFGPENDPYGTHEFGSFVIDGHSVMFKVDCYDTDLQYGSPNPADPEVTTRVLTIFLASEY